jgi:replicative DNA helicase
MVQELSFQTFNDRLPPQNIDAEEAILGGIFLDPEALGRVADLIRPEAFYLTAHQEIFRATLALQSKGMPTDLMSVSAWLRDRDLLEKVGGQSKLIQLIDRTVSAVNIDQYAALVTDKFMRRKLIQVGGEISQLGYDASKDLPQVLDQSEQKVFSITQDRPQSGLTATADILTHTFTDIESRSLGMVLPGLSCGYYDLDAMTQGFQRSDLIIVAGRPSMGKCLAAKSQILLADGSLETIETLYRRKQATLLTLGQDWKFRLAHPSAFVDDGIKPTFRVTTRLGRAIETTLSHPYLTLEGWQPLANLQVGDKVAVPRKIAVFGNETMAEGAVKLLGYLIGDGCLTKASPTFTNVNPAIQQDFQNAVAEFPGVKVKLSDSEGMCAPSFRISKDFAQVKDQRIAFAQRLRTLMQHHSLSANALAQRLAVSPATFSYWLSGRNIPSQVKFEQLCGTLNVHPNALSPDGWMSMSARSHNAVTLWLQKLGLWMKDAHAKTIPAPVFRLQRSQLALFLNRLFATDGWATVLASGQAQVGYATVSQTLAQQVQHLLLRFGVIASLRHRSVKYSDKYSEQRRSVWQLDITDARSIATFTSEIGIFGKEDAVIAVQLAIAEKKYQTNRDLIPLSIWQQLNATRQGEPWQSLARRANIVGHTNIHVGKRAPTRDRLLGLATALQDKALQNLASSDVYWDEIVKIEAMGDQQVYDLTIPDTHNFVANDICVHNTSFVMNIARNIAAFHKLPVAIYSLEMSKEQLVQRLLASEVRIESGRLRSGRVSQQEWEPLGHAISALSEIPIFIDDTPNISVTEIRSKARRLQAEQGGALGLILLDYLQLMDGGSDNRVQELSKITRSLKALARELSVPVIALSQLSRGVEARTNKRPMMSDLRECVTGDTLVVLATGERVPIRTLVGQTPEVISLDAHGKLRRSQSDQVWYVGRKPVYRIKLASGRTIKATAEHRLYGLEGWRKVQDLTVGQRLAVARHLPEPLACATSYGGSAHFSFAPSRRVVAQYAKILKNVALMEVANSDLFWDEIQTIEPLGEEDVYDLTVPETASWLADGIVSHNSGAIEQDADLIMMLYRDEYYNPDTPDRGIAEVIISKHRNGPTGTVKLLFESQFTQFRNLAAPNRM